MKLEYIEFYAGDVKRNSPVGAKSMDMGINLNKAELDEDYLKLDFQYTVLYEPDKSYIRINGIVSFKGKEAKKSYAEWKKTKKITGKNGEEIFNAIYYHASIDAMLLARAFSLSPPLNLPTIRFGAKKK